MHGWWWHLFHDSVRDNMASLAALVILVGGTFLLTWFRPWQKFTARPGRQVAAPDETVAPDDSERS